MGHLRHLILIAVLCQPLGVWAQDGGGADQPEAFAGDDQEVEPCAAQVCCHGVDPRGLDLAFRWAQVAGPAEAVLSDPTAPCVDLTLTAAGEYAFECAVDNGQQASAPDQVRVVVANRAPTCDAGYDSHCLVGERCMLDGRRTADANGDTLSYRWLLSAPNGGAQARLTGAGNKVASFIASSPGRYCFRLECRDPELESTPDEVCVVVDQAARPARREEDEDVFGDHAPIVDCGRRPLIAQIGEGVPLDGRRSYDPDGLPLRSYAWSYVAGPDVEPNLAGAEERAALFTAAREGVHVVELRVEDSPPADLPSNPARWSGPCQAIIQVVAPDNEPPVAVTGDGAVEMRGGRAVLDGGGAHDPDGDPLTYRWTQLRGPEVVLADGDTAAPTFLACTIGLYQFQLVVNDGRTDSLPAEVWATVHSECNLPPVADAGDLSQAECVPPGSDDPLARIELDGRQSHDPDPIEALTSMKFQWLQTGGLTTGIRLAFSKVPYIEPTLWGRYDYRLFVLDAWDAIDEPPPACWSPAWSLPDDVSRIVHCAGNHIPIADAGVDLQWLVGDSVALSGCDSVDGDGDELLYRWRQIRGPAVALELPGTCMPSFVAEAPATWCFELRVDDGWIDSVPDTVCHHVIPNNNRPPSARCPAGALTFRAGVQVPLDGSGSFDPNGDPLTFRWAQTCGQGVALTGEDQRVASFRAPALDADEEERELCFELSVSDGRAAPATCETDVRVVRGPHGDPPPDIPADCPDSVVDKCSCAPDARPAGLRCPERWRPICEPGATRLCLCPGAGSCNGTVGCDVSGASHDWASECDCSRCPAVEQPDPPRDGSVPRSVGCSCGVGGDSGAAGGTWLIAALLLLLGGRRGV